MRCQSVRCGRHTALGCTLWLLLSTAAPAAELPMPGFPTLAPKRAPSGPALLPADDPRPEPPPVAADPPGTPETPRSSFSVRPAGDDKPAELKPDAQTKPVADVHPVTDSRPPAEARPAPDAGPRAKPESLDPIPDAQHAGQGEIEAGSIQGVTPGVSTRDDVQKLWGSPKEVRKQDDVLMQLYSLDGFPRVEVSYRGDRVSSLIIRFESGFPAGTVAEQLGLSKMQPVLISNDLGEVLGQAYPERGVLLSFEPGQAAGKATTKVTHIVLEPISAEPFVLRAETNLDLRADFSLQDLDAALKIQPDNARAHWLRSRALASMGDYEKAAAASGEAVRLAPDDCRYHTSRAAILGQAGRVVEAAAEVQKALELSEKRPHVKARAICLMGDLAASGPRPDFKLALKYHDQAAQEAKPLAASRHPAIRQAAKEVLIDAHLGAAHDIAWGTWQGKEEAVKDWLARAAAAAEDLIASDGGSDEHRFRVNTRALAACAGLRGSLDPAPWAEGALRSGQAIIAATPAAARKAQLQWELGMALYDTLQICQMRSDQGAALRYGERSVEYLEKTERTAKSPGGNFLLGRLYFRLGAIHAIRDSNHRAAVAWFEKALPLFEKPGQTAPADLGRHGETFVSMGVSFWETGQREKAVSLTERGVEWMEQAVSKGTLNRAALSIPYANLASMHRELGQTEKAQRYQEMAAKNQAVQPR